MAQGVHDHKPRLALSLASQRVTGVAPGSCNPGALTDPSPEGASVACFSGYGSSHWEPATASWSCCVSRPRRGRGGGSLRRRSSSVPVGQRGPCLLDPIDRHRIAFGACPQVARPRPFRSQMLQISPTPVIPSSVSISTTAFSDARFRPKLLMNSCGRGTLTGVAVTRFRTT